MSEPLEERASKCSWDCIFWLLRSESCFPHLSTIGLTVVTSLIILQSDCKVIFHLDLDEDFWALLSKMLWVHIGSSWGIYCACLSADIVNCSRQLFFLLSEAMTDCNWCKIFLSLRIVSSMKRKAFTSRDKISGSRTNQPTNFIIKGLRSRPKALFFLTFITS